MNPTRREILYGAAAMTAGWACSQDAPPTTPLPAEPYRFRLAICNETFDGWSFADACKGTVRTGYEAIEIGPHVLSDDPCSISPERRREMRAVMASEGVAGVGIHDILKAPAWLHVTTPDQGRRAKSWNYFRGLIDLCADLGGGGLMIFGSSKQRNTVDGATREEATDRLAAGLAEVAPHAEARGVRILMEPLAPQLCDVVNSLG